MAAVTGGPARPHGGGDRGLRLGSRVSWKVGCVLVRSEGMVLLPVELGWAGRWWPDQRPWLGCQCPPPRPASGAIILHIQEQTVP